jgi:glycosyltransferase involved in cell wall biosynthesis
MYDVGFLKNIFIVLVTHATEIYGPLHALENYLKNVRSSFLIIAHPLYESSLRYSVSRHYVRGRVVREKKFMALRSSEPLLYLQSLVLTIYLVLRLRRRIDIYIGAGNLNALAGIVLRAFGLVGKSVFYVIDYTPTRFKNRVINKIYNLLNLVCVKHVDRVWSVSERIAYIWRNIGLEDLRNYVVPIGIEVEEIPRAFDLSKRRRNVLAFAGHLTREKGVQLVIEAMEDLVKRFPEIRLEIIGTGPFEKELREMVRKKGLEKWISFLGRMDHKRLMQHLTTCGICLATYEPSNDNIAYYADPTKPKEYLACGCPVIITRVPWIAKEIERRQMGIAINYNKHELVEAVARLITDHELYERCQRNALEFVSNLSWETIFSEAFKKIYKI